VFSTSQKSEIGRVKKKKSKICSFICISTEKKKKKAASSCELHTGSNAMRIILTGSETPTVEQ